MSERFAIIIPCYNEASGLESLIQNIQSLKLPADVVIVDDGSTDATARIAQNLPVHLLRLPENLGIGGAVQTGIKWAFRENYDFAIQLDGDGQHPPEMIAKLVSHYKQTHANVVVGSRFLESKGYQSTWARRIGISCIRFFIQKLTGLQVSDPTSGFRLMDKKALQTFSRFYPHDFPEPVSYAIINRFGLKVSETPTAMRDRTHGVSSIAGIKTALYMLRVIGHLFLISTIREESKIA
ncbi:MAG: glycosyltransferase family 2 protein [Bdellovibrionales bacterium]